MVLLTNGQLRKTLSAVRSLGKQGIPTLVAEETFFTPSGFSKYCSKKLIYPNPRNKPEEFHRWLVKVLRKYPCEVLFPMDDDTMDAVMLHREELESLCRLPLPSEESYRIASDKGTATQLAMKSGVDCPVTVFPDNIESLHELTEGMKYPLVIKPRKSSGSRGITVAESKEELEREYKRIHKAFPYPIIQEYIGVGDRYDVCLLFDAQNQLKAFFVQKEIRHFPVERGPSTVQESILHPDLLRKSLQIMSGLPWYGVVELEFMLDQRDQKLKFMEINPRFWNSLQAALFAGVDFPWMLYQLAMGKNVDEVFEYTTGVFCRWMLPGDLLHFLTNRYRKNMNPPFLGGKNHNMRDDILSLQDPFPALGFMMACLRYLPDVDKWKFIFER